MEQFFHLVVSAVEAAGVVLLLVGLLLSTGRYLRTVFVDNAERAYIAYRRDIGRTLLLTLEFLIAADILETVAVERSVNSLALLGGLVVIRTFLSIALEVELNGRWPWQGGEATFQPSSSESKS
jgi:uncharacterized membrane protein